MFYLFVLFFVIKFSFGYKEEIWIREYMFKRLSRILVSFCLFLVCLWDVIFIVV